MADLEKTVQIIFDASDQMTDPLSDIMSSLGEFGDQAVNTASDTEDMNSAIDDISAGVSIDLEATGSAYDDIVSIGDEIGNLPDTYSMDIGLDSTGFDEFLNTFDGFGTEISDTRQKIEDLFSENPGLTETDIEQWQATIEAEVEKEQNTFDLQKKLIEQQIDLLNQKQAALQSGSALITIDSSGLEPALEEIMWQILDKVQIRATEEAGDFLLGL